jgi:hypothetical protein
MHECTTVSVGRTFTRGQSAWPRINADELVEERTLP